MTFIYNELLKLICNSPNIDEKIAAFKALFHLKYFTTHDFDFTLTANIDYKIWEIIPLIKQIDNDKAKLYCNAYDADNPLFLELLDNIQFSEAEINLREKFLAENQAIDIKNPLHLIFIQFSETKNAIYNLNNELKDILDNMKISDNEKLEKCKKIFHQNHSINVNSLYYSWNYLIRTVKISNELIEFLIQQGMPANIVWDKSSTLQTVVDMYIKDNSEKNYELILLLLKHRANPNDFEKGMIPPLVLLVKSNLPHSKINQLLEIFISFGANVNLCNHSKNNALYYAVENQNVDAVEILLKNNAIFWIPNKINRTPLSDALEIGNKKIIELFLQHGAAEYLTNAQINSLLNKGFQITNFKNDNFRTYFKPSIAKCYRNLQKAGKIIISKI